MKSTVPDALPGAGKVAGTVAGVLRILGYALLILGVVSMVAGRARVRAAGERTEFPIRLKAGELFRAPIETSGKAELIVELKVNRHEGVADDAIDNAFSPGTNVLNIGWAVLANGVTNFTGSSTNAQKYFTGAASHRTKGIGQFKPARAGPHEFVAAIYSDQPELDRAHPRIVIRPHPAFAMNASIGGSVRIFGGGLLALIGLILILMARRERENSAANG